MCLGVLCLVAMCRAATGSLRFCPTTKWFLPHPIHSAPRLTPGKNVCSSPSRFFSCPRCIVLIAGVRARDRARALQLVDSGGKSTVFYEKLQCLFVFPPDVQLAGDNGASPKVSTATPAVRLPSSLVARRSLRPPVVALLARSLARSLGRRAKRNNAS